MDFPYGETEIAYLRARDLKLGAAMDRIGPIHREVDPDLFSSVLHHIIGQRHCGQQRQQHGQKQQPAQKSFFHTIPRFLRRARLLRDW